MRTPVLAYHVQPPNGHKDFLAAVVDEDGVAKVYTTRSGAWQPDDGVNMADLIMPEQHWNEFEVEKIGTDEVDLDG